jgi:hypothetical protein
MSVFPARSEPVDRIQTNPRAITGHDHGAGDSRRTAYAVTPIGIAHHRNAGRTRKGRKSGKAVGGWMKECEPSSQAPATASGSYGLPVARNLRAPSR